MMISCSSHQVVNQAREKVLTGIQIPLQFMGVIHQ